MKVIDIIENKINKMPLNYIFTYSDFIIENRSTSSIIKSLNKLEKAGKINKLSKGKFYKSRSTKYGDTKPPAYEIVKDFIEKDGKIIGYLTGHAVYSDLGLTTQISNKIQIGTNKYRRSLKRDKYTVSFVVQPNHITKDNYELLQILDSMRFIKQIPASSANEVCERLKWLVAQLPPQKQTTIVNLSLKYTDYVRALLGAILENRNVEPQLLDKLKKSLNKISEYKIGISETTLLTIKNWRVR
jgi:hypothetical protein